VTGKMHTNEWESQPSLFAGTLGRPVKFPPEASSFAETTLASKDETIRSRKLNSAPAKQIKVAEQQESRESLKSIKRELRNWCSDELFALFGVINKNIDVCGNRTCEVIGAETKENVKDGWK